MIFRVILSGFRVARGRPVHQNVCVLYVKLKSKLLIPFVYISLVNLRHSLQCFCVLANLFEENQLFVANFVYTCEYIRNRFVCALL